MRRISTEEIEECVAEIARKYTDSSTACQIAQDCTDMINGWLDEECRRVSAPSRKRIPLF